MNAEFFFLFSVLRNAWLLRSISMLEVGRTNTGLLRNFKVKAV
jgi:hypothetical protein